MKLTMKSITIYVLIAFYLYTGEDNNEFFKSLNKLIYKHKQTHR